MGSLNSQHINSAKEMEKSINEFLLNNGVKAKITINNRHDLWSVDFMQFEENNTRINTLVKGLQPREVKHFVRGIYTWMKEKPIFRPMN